MKTTTVRGLAAAAVCAFAFGPLATPAAHAFTEGVCDPVADQAELQTALEETAAAKKAFKATNRPLGQLMKETRKEARAEAKQSRAAIKQIRVESRDRSLTPEERAELKAQAKAEQKELRHSLRLLESKKALLAEITAERRAAHAVWKAERVELAAIRAHVEACESSEPTEPSAP